MTLTADNYGCFKKAGFPKNRVKYCGFFIVDFLTHNL